ncbi:hypothetical protein H8E77_07935 [bacterium]|nr:hypothetical protein [bacterium]
MKTQKTTQKMKGNFIWILTSLMFIGLLGMAPMSLAAEDTWTKKTDMPTARMGHSASVVNEKIYVIGGYNGPVLSTVEEYDSANGTWTTKSGMPTPRWLLSNAVVNGKIYAIGGANSQLVGFPMMEEYAPATDTWTTKSSMPTARVNLSTCVVDGKIYAIGGQSGANRPGLSTVEEYDPATDTWTKKTDMPTARCWLSLSVVNRKIYAIGGASAPTLYPPLLTVEEYDPMTETWTKKSDMPTAKSGASTSVVNRKIYVIGGTTTGFPYSGVVSTVEEYDPATDTWTKKANMPTVRCMLSTSAVDGKIYAIGGTTTGISWTYTSTVEEYDTGFVPEVISNVNAKGKVSTTWGEIKRSR